MEDEVLYLPNVTVGLCLIFGGRTLRLGKWGEDKYSVLRTAAVRVDQGDTRASIGSRGFVDDAFLCFRMDELHDRLTHERLCALSVTD